MSTVPTPPTTEDAMQMHKDDRVHELFKWIQDQERNGVSAETIFNEIADRAKPRYGLELARKLDKRKDVWEVTFLGTKRVIRNNGSKWELT